MSHQVITNKKKKKKKKDIKILTLDLKRINN